MQNLFFHSRRPEVSEPKQSLYWSVHVHLRQFHRLPNMHLLPKVVHWLNRNMKLDSRKYFGRCHAPGHYESDISNSVRLTYFDALISNKHSSQLSGTSKNLHTQSICFNRDNTRKINLEFLTSIVIHSFCISFRRVPMRSCHHQWNIGPPWKSCDRELLWDSRASRLIFTNKMALEPSKNKKENYWETKTLFFF